MVVVTAVAMDPLTVVVQVAVAVDPLTVVVPVAVALADTVPPSTGIPPVEAVVEAMVAEEVLQEVPLVIITVLDMTLSHSSVEVKSVMLLFS